jgi:hypothetical protein
MHRVLSVLLLVVTAAAVAAAPAVAVRRPASGHAQILSLTFTGARTAGGNTILEGIESGLITGSLTGTYVERFVYTIHADGSTGFRSHMMFTGSVEGCGSGTVPAVVEGRGDGAATRGTQTIVGGDENTLGARGELDFTADLASGTIFYVGEVDC